MRRIGVLMNQAADDPEAHERSTAFRQGLQQLGWIEGRNVRLDIRYGAANPDSARKGAAELVALAPDILADSSGAVGVGNGDAATAGAKGSARTQAPSWANLPSRATNLA